MSLFFKDLNTWLKAASGDENAMMEQEDTKPRLASTRAHHDLFGKRNKLCFMEGGKNPPSS